MAEAPPDPAPAAPAPSGSAGADAAVVLGCLAVLGLVAGVLWWVLVQPAEFTKLASGGSMGEVDLGRRFGADGWYVVVAGAAGLVAGAVLSWWRSRDPLLTTLLVLVGSAVAAALMALTGHLLGPGDPQQALARAATGARVPDRLAVHAVADYLAWPIGVLLGSLVVLWGRPAETSLADAPTAATDRPS